MHPSQARTARPSEGDETRRPQAPAPLVLERYRLTRRLGAGAFGTVWMARDERLERDVAVKILARDRIVGGRFEREARAAARLSHPGIVTLYEASVDDEGAYLVSELVRGKTLDWLLEAGELSDRDIVAIGVALCDALAHAHEEGVVHRDVKPSNVLVPSRPATPAQRGKLTDFGVARVLGGDALTMTGDVIGTLAYMAPEQAEGLEAGPSADLYSLALVLYEALTGINPAAVSTSARRARRLGAHLPPLRRQRRDLPRILGAGIDLALRPRPRERGRVIDLRRALAAAFEQVDDEPGVVSAPWITRDERSQHGPAPVKPSHDGSSHDSPDPEDDWVAPAEQRPSADPEPWEPTLADVPAWPARGLAATGAAATAAWLTTRILAPSPLPPLGAALLAAALVILLPRLGWLVLLVAAGASAAAQGHGGFALIAVVALLIPVPLLPLRASCWPLAAGAPALGLIGLAGAWPALAALARNPWRRAALAATGWVWLLLATPLAGHNLYLLAASGPAAEPWRNSVSMTARHVLAPLARSGALAPAVVWALAAVLAPWLVRGRSLGLDVIRTVIWSGVVVAAVPAAVAAVGGAGTGLAVHGAVIGAIAAAVIVLAPRWLAPLQVSWLRARRTAGLGPHFP